MPRTKEQSIGFVAILLSFGQRLRSQSTTNCCLGKNEEPCEQSKSASKDASRLWPVRQQLTRLNLAHLIPGTCFEHSRKSWTIAICDQSNKERRHPQPKRLRGRRRTASSSTVSLTSKMIELTSGFPPARTGRYCGKPVSSALNVKIPRRLIRKSAASRGNRGIT